MRRATRNNWTARLTGFVLVSTLCSLLAVPECVHAAAGISISPATATLSLAKNENQQHATFTITNNYTAPVALHFVFAQAVKTPGASAGATQQLGISPNDVTLAGGASVTPIITLSDSDKLSPGSQQVELIITQQPAPGGNNVSVVPSIRMPLIIIKEDGAVSNLTLSALGTPHFTLGLPGMISLKIKNTGNMLAIPRGFISIEDSRGRQVSKGVLNTASAAIAPEGQIQLSTPMTHIDRSWLPGAYRVRVSFGVGGGQPAQTLSARMFYVPAWQPLLAVLIIGLVLCLRRIWVEWAILQRVRQDKPKPPAKPGQPATTEKGAL